MFIFKFIPTGCGFAESVGLRGRLLRKIEALKAEQSSSEAPNEFLCPITTELMKDPVIAAGLFTLKAENRCPLACASSDTVTQFSAIAVVLKHKLGVCSSDGYSYERESIERWIGGKKKTSPMTNLPLQTTLLTPNRSLKMAITRWKSSQ